MSNSTEYAKLLEIGRPPNIKKLFPNSQAFIVSGKVIDRAMIAKGSAMTMAANWARNRVIPVLSSRSRTFVKPSRPSSTG